MMRMERVTIELIPDEELGGFTARIPDISCYGQGETEETAIADLKEALRAYVEEFGLDGALACVNSAPSGPPQAQIKIHRWWCLRFFCLSVLPRPSSI
jgi:predicted RNase H-like HicB family nuclease